MAFVQSLVAVVKPLSPKFVAHVISMIADSSPAHSGFLTTSNYIDVYTLIESILLPLRRLGLSI